MEFTKVKMHGPWRYVAVWLALAVLAVGQAYAQVAASDQSPLLRALNAVRQQGCQGRPGPATALSENALLSGTAALIADGRQLGDALQATGYRAVGAAQITLQGTIGTATLTGGAIAKACSTITQGDLTEAGFHQSGTQTWIVLAAPFSLSGAAQEGNLQAQILALVNEARAQPRQCGNKSFAATRPIRLNATLQGIASTHAEDMARHNYFSHASRDGGHVDDRASHVGYRWRTIGENIAAGQMQADAAVQGWLKSPDHCANIMSPTYNDMGVAFAVNNKSSAGMYWVQVFAEAR